MPISFLQAKFAKKISGPDHEIIILSITQELRPHRRKEAADNKKSHNKNHTKKSSDLPN
jgi:hypothetical protein